MLERLVTVATFDDTVRAALAKNHLEAAGIAAVLSDELTVGIDWALSTAIGGIKLQVSPLHVERAEYVLAELTAAREEPGQEVEFVTSPEAARELAEERAAQREEEGPSNQLADRAWRAAVIGFLFWPLHIYVWWLLLSLTACPQRVSPGRRWKVWAAGLLNLPVLAAVSLLAALASSYFPYAPDDLFDQPHWREEGFVPFGREVYLRLPNPHTIRSGEDFTPAGERILSKAYRTRVKSQEFGLLLVLYPLSFANVPAAQLYAEQVQHFLAHNGAAGAPARVREERDINLGGRPGKEILLQGRRHVRLRLVMAEHRLYCLDASGSAEDMRNDLTYDYFASFALH